MRPKKPRRASLEEVRITRDGETAVIENADPDVSVVHLAVGPQIEDMSDAAILELFTWTMEAQDQVAAGFDRVVIEIPPGRTQIRYSEECDQWVPRGQALRCLIDDDENGELVIHVDDQALGLDKFGRLLKTYAGWGMRIAFVPDDHLTEEPEVEVRDPDREETQRSGHLTNARRLEHGRRATDISTESGRNGAMTTPYPYATTRKSW